MKLRYIALLPIILFSIALLVSCGEKKEKPSLEEILGKDFFAEDSAKAKQQRQQQPNQQQQQQQRQGDPSAGQQGQMPPQPQAQVDPQLQQIYQKAIEKMNKNDIKGGIAELTKAIKMNQFIPDLYQTRGVALMRLNNFDLALQDFSKAIALNPDFVQAYQMRSNIYMQKNQLKNAASDLRHLARLMPPEPPQQKSAAFSRAGSISIQANDFEGAKQLFDQALKFDANNVEAITGMGYLYMQLQKIENAMNNFNKAIQLYPSNGPALFYRGSLKIALGDTAGACADWEKSKSFNYPQASKLLEKFCNKK